MKVFIDKRGQNCNLQIIYNGQNVNPIVGYQNAPHREIVELDVLENSEDDQELILDFSQFNFEFYLVQAVNRQNVEEKRYECFIAPLISGNEIRNSPCTTCTLPLLVSRPHWNHYQILEENNRRYKKFCKAHGYPYP